MSENHIGDKGARSLGEAIKQHSSLQSLDVSENHIGNRGVASLGEAIKLLASLQSLHMTGNFHCKAGVARLGEAIKLLPACYLSDSSNPTSEGSDNNSNSN